MFKISKLNIFFLIVIFSIAIWILTGTSLAAEYPERAITIVVPAKPGGSTDMSCRTVAKYIQKYIGQPLVIKNIPGGSASVGSRKVLDSKPDGYTLLFLHLNILTNYHTGVANFTWDSFTPICQVNEFIEVLLVHKDSQFKTVNELVKEAKLRPGEILWGLSVGGGLHFIYGEFTTKTGTEFVIVPGGGDHDQVTKLLGRHIDVVAVCEMVAKPYIDSGDLRCLGYMSDKRSVLLPNVPTLKEQGIDLTFMYEPGFYGPPNVPDYVVEKVSQATKKALNDPECIKDLLKIGMYPAYLSSSEFKNHLQELDAKFYFLSIKTGLLKRRK
jgi:tripartite-type tricarboxylate transporter receptor subunit TctC